MKALNKEVGRIGESIAEEFLLKKGYNPIARNFFTKFGEIDLILKDDSILVFVEVKTKKSLRLGTPEEMFTPRKYERVKRMAILYLNGREIPCRIDMVAVILSPDNQLLSLNHYPNVYPL